LLLLLAKYAALNRVSSVNQAETSLAAGRAIAGWMVDEIAQQSSAKINSKVISNDDEGRG